MAQGKSLTKRKCKFVLPDGSRCKRDAKEDSDYCTIPQHDDPDLIDLTDKQRRFVDEYPIDMNAAAAARRAGYSELTAGQIGSRLLRHPNIKRWLEKRMKEMSMSAVEAIKRMTDWGRGSLSPFFHVDDVTGEVRLNLASPEAQENLHLIKKIEFDEEGHPSKIELHDSKDAVDKILKIHGKYIDHFKVEDITPKPWDKEKGDPKEYIRKQLNS